MIEEQALVVKVDQQRVWVASAQTGGCGGCSQKAGCATQAVASVLKQKQVAVEVDSSLHLKVGDTVTVAIDESLLLTASLQMYFLPLIAMFAGGGVIDWLLPDEAAAEVWIAGGALLSLLLSLWGLHHVQHWYLFGFYTRPVVVKKG